MTFSSDVSVEATYAFHNSSELEIFFCNELIYLIRLSESVAEPFTLASTIADLSKFWSSSNKLLIVFKFLIGIIRSS